jgi:hypothetical protein
MAKKPASSEQQVPSTELDYLNQSVEPFELTPPGMGNRTASSTTVPEEAGTRWDERYYPTHWGINE